MSSAPWRTGVVGGTVLTEQLDWRLAGRNGLQASPGRASSPDPESFRAAGSRWMFGPDIDISSSVQSPYAVNFGTEDEADTVSVVFVRTGAWTLTESERTLHFSAGDAGFIRSKRPVLAQNVDVSTIIAVSMPREILTRTGVEIRSGLGSFERSGLRDPTLSFLIGLTASAAESPIPTEPAAALIVQLMAGLFLEERGYRMDSDSVVSGLWARGQALITAQAADSELTPTALATQLNVSVRHLQRAFALVGQTPAEAIRARRVHLARAEIIGGQSTFADIAGRTGFATEAELRRAFAVVHATTPRDLRNAKRATDH